VIKTAKEGWVSVKDIPILLLLVFAVVTSLAPFMRRKVTQRKVRDLWNEFPGSVAIWLITYLMLWLVLSALFNF